MRKRKQLHNNSHLTLEQRKIIQAGIENNSTKASIARTLGKDATTVAKEIRKHRTLKPRNTFNRPILCAKRKSCEIKLASQVAADLRNQAAIAVINHQELAPYTKFYLHTRKSLRANIESGIFKAFGVDNFSLKEQVNRRQFKQKYKKRKERANFEGRRYEDFRRFHLKNPDTPVTEMDTVYNSPHGPFLQTFMFEKASFMIGFLHNGRANESMSATLDFLQDKIGIQLFSKLFSLFLTDRGSEFEKHQMFELGKNGNTRLSIFYCDPMQAYQKPHVENNHNYVRDIIPNHYPMDTLSQNDINLMFSHINSTPRRSLGDRTPYELFCFLYGKQMLLTYKFTGVWGCSRV